MGCLRTHEIVAAVVRRSDNEIARGKRVERDLEHGRRQVWAVAIERDDTPTARHREVREHRSEARGKAITDLRHDAHGVTGRAGQIFDIGRRAHNGDFHAVE